MMGYGGWDGGAWIILPILMCIGMVVMMVLMMGPVMHRHMGGHGGGHTAVPRSDRALEVLRQRFANGELTQQEYEEWRHVLLTPSHGGRTDRERLGHRS
jgi:putative membrane protein